MVHIGQLPTAEFSLSQGTSSAALLDYDNSLTTLGDSSAALSELKLPSKDALRKLHSRNNTTLLPSK